MAGRLVDGDGLGVVVMMRLDPRVSSSRDRTTHLVLRFRLRRAAHAAPDAGDDLSV